MALHRNLPRKLGRASLVVAMALLSACSPTEPTRATASPPTIAPISWSAADAGVTPGCSGPVGSLMDASFVQPAGAVCELAALSRVGSRWEALLVCPSGAPPQVRVRLAEAAAGVLVSRDPAVSGRLRFRCPASFASPDAWRWPVGARADGALARQVSLPAGDVRVSGR